MKVTYLIAWDTGLWSTEVHEADAKPSRNMDTMRTRLLRWANEHLSTQAHYRTAVAFAVKGFDGVVAKPPQWVEVPNPPDQQDSVDFKCQLYSENQMRWLDACDYGTYDAASTESKKCSLFGDRTRVRGRVTRVSTVESRPAQ